MLTFFYHQFELKDEPTGEIQNVRRSILNIQLPLLKHSNGFAVLHPFTRSPYALQIQILETPDGQLCFRG
jgi:hypothetical protein